MNRLRASQKGTTLLVGLIMLVLMTLLALTTFNMGKGNLIVVGNMQHRNESLAAVESALNEVQSNPDLGKSSTNLFKSGGTSKSYDINGDGSNDISVALTASPCVVVKPIPRSDPAFSDQQDDVTLKCTMTADQQQFGTSGATQTDTNSDCYWLVWDIQATSTDSKTKAQVVVTKGIGLIKHEDEVADYCP